MGTRIKRQEPTPAPDKLQLGFKGCSTCKGYVTIGHDHNGGWLACQNCGRRRDLMLAAEAVA